MSWAELGVFARLNGLNLSDQQMDIWFILGFGHGQRLEKEEFVQRNDPIGALYNGSLD